MAILRSPIRYVCDQIISPTDDIRLITLLPVTDEHIQFSPGQYIEALLPGEESLPLSIANVPNSDGALHFHIRLYSNTLAQTFLDVLFAQNYIDLAGPYGNFTQKRIHPTAQPLFLAGGVGFAPIQSLLTVHLPANTTPCHLFWGIKHAQECYAHDLLAHWQEKHPHFNVTIALSDPTKNPEWPGERGWIHEVLMRYYADLSKSQVFACGPHAMINAAYKALKQCGLKSEHFISDMPAITI